MRKNITIELNKEQEEILFGGLLGDCCLYKPKNGNAQITYLSSIRNHTEYFGKFFNDYSTNECKFEPKENKTYDKRTNKEYTSYRFRSQLNEGFTSYYNKWYINGIKIVPEDLVLTPKICLMWYLGDGSINNNHISKSTASIKLSTNSFTVDEINKVLIPQLSEFNAVVNFNDGKPIIIIPRIKVETFLSYIGECPFEEYKYKWIVYPYKYKKYENGYDKINHEELVNDYIKSKLYSNEYAKKNNIEQSLLKYHLTKAGINEKERINLKYTIINPENEFFYVNNIKEFCLKNELSYGGMFHVLNGRDITHRGWKIYKNK